MEVSRARSHKTAKTTKKYVHRLKESRPPSGEPNLKTKATRRRKVDSRKARKKEDRNGWTDRVERPQTKKARKTHAKKEEKLQEPAD